MLKVRVLGDLEIELDGSTLESPASRRARALLGWLVVDRRMHPRSALAARFWPDVLDESARTSLRSALSALRKSLGPDSGRYLLARRDDVGVAREAEVWTDVAEFDRCIEQERLEDALALCRGELLAGLEDDWIYECRDNHRDRVAEVLARLAARAEGQGDLRAAIEQTRRQVALDPLAEEPQRDLMRRMAAAGDRPGALRAYERLSRRLRDDLRIAPSQATRELAAALRQGGEAASGEIGAATVEHSAAVVTLLFTDQVGSTALLDKLGDDESERLRRMHFGLLRDVAAAHKGQEVKNLGDGLMVAFPSAVNAVGCAIGIQQAMHRYSARHPDDRLQVRVGLNVGEPILHEGDYFGTPVVVAKRLCDAADGGQILASALVRGLVGSRGGFGFRSLGPTALKGISERIEAWEVEWDPAEERRVTLPAPLVVSDAAPLVGRDAQLDELRDRWEKTRAGARRVAVLVGEPGIGKTRLAAEFCRGAHSEGALVLLGRCYEVSPVTYQPFVEALRHYVSESPLDEITLQVGPHRATLATLVPELADPAQEAVSPGTDSPEREQFLLFEAVASLLRTVADEHPLILLLDDLHWADTPTVQLLRHLVRATEQTPLLILGTYRDTEVDESHPLTPALAELRRARALDSFTLAGLADEDVAALISSQAGHAAPATFARSMMERTEGNPFFVEELLRDISGEDDWNAALARIELPQSVKDVLLRRLSRLDEACRHVVRVAAVTGREFALELLERVTDLAADRVAESLEDAIAAHIVEETTSIGRYSFAHALIRETVYEQLSRTRRAQLHRMIGEAIESAAGDRADDSAGELAYHFSAAGNLEKAYKYHALAATAARRVYAVEPALWHYSAALEAGAELGLRADRDSLLLDLLLQRGRFRWRIGDFDGAAADLEGALAAARRCGQRATEMEALNELGIMHLWSNMSAAASSHEAALEIAHELGDTVAETNALDRLAVIGSHRLEFDRALELGERALELARGTGDPIVVGRAIDSIKLAALQLGDLARLEEFTAELEALWRERSDLWYLQWTLLEGSFVPMARARWSDASERLADAVAINRRVRDPLAETLMLDALCCMHRSRGAYEEALATGRRAVSLSVGIGWEGWAAATLGWTLLDVRAASAAVEVLERGLAAGERIGDRNEIVRCLGQLAWARLLLGDMASASGLAARAEQMLEHVTAPSGAVFLFGTQAYAAVGRVLIATANPERSEALLRPVVDAASRAGWYESAAITELVLGLSLEALGKLDRAVETLSHSAELADNHGIPATGWEAHASLARLAQDPAEHLTTAHALVERVAASLNDDSMRAHFREQAKL